MVARILVAFVSRQAAVMTCTIPIGMESLGIFSGIPPSWNVVLPSGVLLFVTSHVGENDETESNIALSDDHWDFYDWVGPQLLLRSWVDFFLH